MSNYSIQTADEEINMYALHNCEIFSGTGVINNHTIIIENDLIQSVIPEKNLPDKIEKIDLNGSSISPGFIDIQINGGGGILFNDSPTVDSIKTIYQAHRKYGTTNWLPTFITGSREGLQQAVATINKCAENNRHGVLGIHIEGPFINPEEAGVHDKNYIRKINQKDLDVILSVNKGISLLTLAPEMVPVKYIKSLSKQGIRVSAGHSNATFEEATESFARGISHVTHLFNAMSDLDARKPGLVGAALFSRNVWCSFIADGHHVHFANLELSLRLKEKGKAFLVSDAMPSLGTKVKEFYLGKKKISVMDGKCFTEDGILAGSSLDMMSAVRNCIDQIGIQKEEALRMASTYPAQFLGIDDSLGKIAPGFKANMTIINKSLQIAGTVVDGKLHKNKSEW